MKICALVAEKIYWEGWASWKFWCIGQILKTFQKFLSNHVLEYQNTSLLVQAMQCTAANTSPVERGYTVLQIVTFKCRNWIIYFGKFRGFVPTGNIKDSS